MTTPALIGRLACVAGVALAFLGGLCLPAVFPITPVPPVLLPLVLLAAAGLIGFAVYQFRAEAAALRAETRLLESAVVHARDAVVVLEGEPAAGPGRRVLYANDAFCHMTGYTRAEVVGRSLHHLRGPDSDQSTLDQIRDALAAGRPFQAELRNRRKDGSGYWVELSLVPVPGSAGRIAHWVMIQRDVTDRKRTEEQLREARKLEAVGRLAGGIAHDFNNLMTGVIGNLALVRLPADDPNRPLLATAEQAAARVADLTRKLLGYAGRSQIVPGPVDPREALDEAAATLDRDPRLRVEVSVAPGCGPVLADRALLGQALAGLCENARDAMPGGGTLTLSAEAVQATPPPAPDGSDPPPGWFVRIRVADTGTGMTDEVKAHLFEPFFTTKGPDKGTGLGLPMVRGIARKHGGWVDCTSAPGTGTRIDLYLPAAEVSMADTAEAVAPETATALHKVRTPPTLPHPGSRPTADTPPPAAGTTVLLVDDEEMVRNLGRLILERAGYRVLTAADGQEAVEVFARERDRVGLVVLDINMPRMSGPEAFRHIHDLAPAVRVLFLTGFAAEGLAELEGAAGVLAKPYRPPELVAAVRDALAASAGTGSAG